MMRRMRCGIWWRRNGGAWGRRWGEGENAVRTHGVFTNCAEGATIAANLVALVEKIVSGGQTGADRAGLDFAIEHGIPHFGWCPKGRKAEDGSIDWRYDLKETPSSDYPQRTEWNVRDSDG